MKNKHLSLEERSIIERLVQEGKSNKAIAELLGRSKSTIGRELERNCWRLNCREYRSEAADGFAKKRRKHERKSRISEEIWQKIFEYYNEDWSPEQISGALKLRGVCVSLETIYRRIYAGIKADRLDPKHLRWNRPKRRCRLSKRAPRDLTKTSIEKRPDLSSRVEFGHWLSWFAAKATSSRWLNATRDFYWLRTFPTRKPTPSETLFYRCFGTFCRP